MLYLKLFLGVLTCIAVFHVLGQLISNKYRPFKGNLLNFAFKQILGSIAFVAIYAVVFTMFRTVFVLVIPLLIAVYYLTKKQIVNTLSKDKMVFTDFVFPVIFVFFSTLISFLVIRGDLSSGMKVPIKDQAFYSILAKSLSAHSTETFKSMLTEYTNASGLFPYHYYELWLASAFIKAFNVNPLLAQSGITYAYSLFVVFCLVMGTLEVSTVKTGRKILFLFFTLTFVFHRSWLAFIFPGDLYSDSIFYDGHYKFIHLIPVFLLIISLIYHKQNFLAALFFLMIPAINSVTLPWVGLAFVLLLIFAFFLYRPQQIFKHHIWFIVVLLTYLIFGVYYIKILESTNGSGFIKSIGGIVFNVLINGSKWLLINLVLIAALIYFSVKSKSGNMRDVFVFLIVVFASSILARALMDTNQNSFQIFLSASFLLIYSMVLLLGIQWLKNEKWSRSFLILPLLSLALFIQNYGSISHVFKRNISKYDIGYIEKIANLKLDNSKGLKIINTDKMTNLMKNPVYAGLNEYFVFNDMLYCAAIYNTDQLLPAEDDQSFQSNALRNEFLPLCYYNTVTETGPYVKDSLMKSNALKNYIKNFKPSYLIVDDGCETPLEFNAIIETPIIDSNSKERFYKLKQ